MNVKIKGKNINIRTGMFNTKSYISGTRKDLNNRYDQFNGSGLVGNNNKSLITLSKCVFKQSDKSITNSSSCIIDYSYLDKDNSKSNSEQNDIPNIRFVGDGTRVMTTINYSK